MSDNQGLSRTHKMSAEQFVDPDRITPFSIHAYSQRREDWTVEHINAGFDTIARVAASISPEIRIEKAGKFVKWSYLDKPDIYIAEDGLYAVHHSLAAHESAARVISILKSKGLATATRGSSKRLRVLNDPAREMIRKNSLRKDDKILLHFLGNGGQVEIGRKWGDGILTEKRAKRLEKKKLALIVKGADGKDYIQAHPDAKKVEAIIYRGFDAPKSEKML